MGTRDSFPGGQSGRGMKLTTPPPIAEVDDAWSYIASLPQYVFMAWCSVKAQRLKPRPFLINRHILLFDAKSAST